MDSETANNLIFAVQVVGIAAAVGWKYAVKSAVRRFAKDARARGYAVRSSSDQEAFVTFGAAEVGAVVEIEIVKRKTKYGTKDVEVITQHWHARIDLPSQVGAFSVSRGAPGHYSRAPIPLGAGLTADVGDGKSAALFDDAVKAAIVALRVDAKLQSLNLSGNMLYGSWRRRRNSLTVAKALGAKLEDVAAALVAASAAAGDVDDSLIAMPSPPPPQSAVGRFLSALFMSPYNRELSRIEPLLREANAAGHRLSEVDGDRGFVVMERLNDIDVFVAPTVDTDTGSLRRSYRLGVSVDVDGSFDIGTASSGYGAMERRLGSRLIASAHDAGGLDALRPEVVRAILAIDAQAKIVSATLKRGRLTIFCNRRGATFARAMELAAATKAVAVDLKGEHP